VLLPVLLHVLLPGLLRWFVGAFFPTDMSLPARQAALELMGRAATTGGALALLTGGLALATSFGRLRGEIARLAVVGLVAADLLRAGAGLNPMTRPSFFEVSPEMRAVAEEVRENGRALVCPYETTRAYWRARSLRGDRHERWTFAVMAETHQPHLNMLHGVPTALGEDQTSLVPLRALPASPQVDCSLFETIAPRVRAAAVTHLISLDPLDSPFLQFERVVAPPRLAPVAIHVYRMRHPLPRAAVARSVVSIAAGETPSLPADDETVRLEGTVAAESGASGRVRRLSEGSNRVSLTVEADRPTVVLLRDTWTPGWTARVDGRPAPVLRANGLHRAVPIPAGSSEVVLSYWPPGLTAGLLIALLALAALVALETASALRSRRNRAAASATILALLCGAIPSHAQPAGAQRSCSDRPLA
jgi:hypothetical protein